MHTINANGAHIPALGLGTWTLKGRQCQDLVESAIAAGYRHIDTASMYDNEEDVGAAIAASGLARSELFVTTKVWWSDIAPGDLERSAEESLRRLGLDHVDLLLIHWPNPHLAVEPSIEALNRVRSSGMARNIGVSNFPTALLGRAIAASQAPLACNQVEYHPKLDQSKLIDMCRTNNMALVSYCPLFRGSSLFDEPAIRAASSAHDKKPAQIVLRWHVQQDSVAAIPRTTSKAHLKENLDIFDFALSASEMEAISSIRRAGIRICDYDFSPQWDEA